METTFNSKRHQNLYTLHKGKLFNYRMTFLLFGLTFLGLGWVAMKSNPSWLATTFLWDCMLAKWAAIGASLMLSFIAFSMTINIKLSKEMTNLISTRALSVLNKAYTRKRNQLGISIYLPYSSESYRKESLRHSYEEAVDKLEYARDEHILLLEEVRNQDFDSQERESLYNEILAKFQAQAMGIVDNFEK